MSKLRTGRWEGVSGSDELDSLLLDIDSLDLLCCFPKVDVCCLIVSLVLKLTRFVDEVLSGSGPRLEGRLLVGSLRFVLEFGEMLELGERLSARISRHHRDERGEERKAVRASCGLERTRKAAERLTSSRSFPFTFLPQPTTIESPQSSPFGPFLFNAMNSTLLNSTLEASGPPFQAVFDFLAQCLSLLENAFSAYVHPSHSSGAYTHSI